MITAPEKSQSSGYIPSLDGIRAVAVALVMAAHAGYGDIVPGGLGVSIFFFLSGYLITTLFYRELSAAGGIDLRAFYLRRILRLTPPLLVSLIIGYGLLACGLAGGGFNLTSLAAQVFYGANYHQLYGAHRAVVEGQTVLWSLAVEEHFYFIYPLLFLGLLRLPNKSARLLALVGLLVLGLGWRVILRSFSSVPSDHLYYATDARLDSILYGCLLSVATHEGLAEYFPKKTSWVLIVQSLGVALLLFTLVYRDNYFRDTIRYSLQGVAFLPLFHYAVHRPNALFHRVLNYRPIKLIGVYSYSIYLLHHVIIESLVDTFAIDARWLVLLISSAVSIGYGALIYQTVDKPMMRIRRKLHKHG